VSALRFQTKKKMLLLLKKRSKDLFFFFFFFFARRTLRLSLSHETTTTPKPFERLGRAYNINTVRLACGDRRFLISLTSGNWRDFYCLGFESHGLLKCKAKS
jgi:hypothetical protein